MMGNDLTQLSISLAKLINLAVFDVVDLTTLTVEDTVNPLVKVVKARITQEIPKQYLSTLRKLIKKTCISHDFYAGAISFKPELNIKIYLKRRIKPAWLQDSELGSQEKYE